MSETQMFRVPLSQVEGRLDPFFYQQDVLQFIKGIREKTNCKKLGALGHFERGVVYTSEDECAEGVPVLRANNVNLATGQLDLNDLVRISTALKFDQRQKIRVGDILICGASGSKDHAGKACMINQPLEAYIGGFMLVLRCHPSVNAEYLGYYLQSKLFRTQIHRHLGGTNINNVSAELLKNLDIVLPELDIQLHIATLMRDAHAQKTRLEAEAKALLDSVDTVLFRHWGRISPNFPADSLTQRIFKVSINAIDNRLDAPANWAPFDLRSPVYPSVRLSQIAAINPSTDFSDLPESGAVSFVPMDCVDEVWGEVTEDHSRLYSESKGYTEFQEGDVLWAKITPCMQNGKSAIAQGLLHQRGFGSTEFHVFRVDASQLDARYLLAVLRLRYLRKYATLFFGGSAGHQRVDASFFQKLAIPLPPLAVQQKIAAEIEHLKTQAQVLGQQAQAVLDQAKQQTEQLILGELA